MKKINYKFCDGTSSIVEVSDEFYSYYEELERTDRNNERRETRRHISLDFLHESGVEIPAEEEVYETSPFDTIDNEMLLRAIDELLPCQKELIVKVYFENKKIKDIADSEGVLENTISRRLARILQKIRKNFI